MTLTDTITDYAKNVELTPLYAAVGVTDLSVEKAREARERLEQAGHDAGARAERLRTEFTTRVEQARTDLEPAKIQERAAKRLATAWDLPVVVLDKAQVAYGKAGETYGDLAARGKRLVERIRTQQATQDLAAQAETALAQAKGAVTSVRHAAADIEESAKAAAATGRTEAERVHGTVVASVKEEAKVVEAEVEGALTRTMAAAEEATDAARTATKRATTKAKAAGTSARKTTAAARKATEEAAEKLGD